MAVYTPPETTAGALAVLIIFIALVILWILLLSPNIFPNNIVALGTGVFVLVLIGYMLIVRTTRP